MSIYVYVTRKSDPLKDSGPEITLDEWHQAVANDPDLSLDNPPNKSPRDKTVYAVWKSFPAGYPAWFGLSGGSIAVKGLDDAILGKLRNFAATFRGRIVSEEGEEFT